MNSDAQVSIPAAPQAAPAFPAASPPAVSAAPLPEGMRLHIGGKVRAPGWTILDILPGPHVDILGDCSDLSAIADNSCAVVYASHVIEHLGYNDTLPRALLGFHRILAPGGQLMVGVPDLEALCRLFTQPGLTPDDRFFVMRMMFGGRMDAYDVHLVGLNAEFLGAYLTNAGFVDLRRIPSFGLFQDATVQVFKGCPTSLNVIGRKPS